MEVSKKGKMLQSVMKEKTWSALWRGKVSESGAAFGEKKNKQRKKPCRKEWLSGFKRKGKENKNQKGPGLRVSGTETVLRLKE